MRPKWAPELHTAVWRMQKIVSQLPKARNKDAIPGVLHDKHQRGHRFRALEGARETAPAVPHATFHPVVAYLRIMPKLCPVEFQQRREFVERRLVLEVNLPTVAIDTLKDVFVRTRLRRRAKPSYKNTMRVPTVIVSLSKQLYKHRRPTR